MASAPTLESLRQARARFVLERLSSLQKRSFDLEEVRQELQGAPVQIRANGLLLGLAAWERSQRPALDFMVDLVQDWIECFSASAFTAERPLRSLRPLRDYFESLARLGRREVSALEHEAIAVLQCAKVLAEAVQTAGQRSRINLPHGTEDTP